MLLAALALALALAREPGAAIAAFSAGFGQSLGTFALILLPSFALAEALGALKARLPGRLARGAAPVLGAAMVCPDTAYATLAPIAGRRRAEVAFGAFAGFKLLYPAGPLIVATGLGVAPSGALFVLGLGVFVPVWIAGQVWARMAGGGTGGAIGGDAPTAPGAAAESLRAYAPLVLLFALIALGLMPFAASSGRLGFLTTPSGALLAGAALALALLEPSARRPCVEAAMRRTAGLLLLIGIAAALGSFFTQVLPANGIGRAGGGAGAVLTLFALTAGFKMAQGSSMATFAAVTPVVAPLVASSGLSAPLAVMAICAGSLFTILPNDSFFWLVREDALAGENDRRALMLLAAGGALQAMVALAGVLMALEVGL
jgi:GntP family gluconate:H+ symporter